MVHLAQSCDSPCLQTLKQMRQVHLATGYNSGKVAEALIILEALDEEALKSLGTHFPLLSVLQDDGRVHALLDSSLGVAAALYLVDPLGNVMLHYAPGFDASGLRKDLDRLLRYNKTSNSSP